MQIIRIIVWRHLHTHQFDCSLSNSYQIVDVARLTVRHPVHAADNATKGKNPPPLALPLAILLKRLAACLILIEPTVLKVGFSAAPKFALAVSLDSVSSQFRCQLIVSVWSWC